MIAWFTEADIAVVTLGAVAGVDSEMVESCTREIGGVMAGDTVFCGRQVVVEFADTDHVVVARLTVVDDAEVVVGPGREAAWCVADAAVFRRRHMVRGHTAGGYAMA